MSAPRGIKLDKPNVFGSHGFSIKVFIGEYFNFARALFSLCGLGNKVCKLFEASLTFKFRCNLAIDEEE
jgi:hypothetical protein